MGDIADMMLEGILCQYCGVLLDDVIETGEGCGFPSSCAECSEEEEKPKPAKKRKKHKSKRNGR